MFCETYVAHGCAKTCLSTCSSIKHMCFIVTPLTTLLTLGTCIVIDKSMNTFRGRLSFQEYNPSKAHKYRLKIYKLCTVDGYIRNWTVYAGSDPQIAELSKPDTVVVQLCECLLDKGRLLVCDNFYTSYALAQYLLRRKTYLCGILRVNRLGNPQALKTK